MHAQSSEALDPHFIRHPYLTGLNLVVNAEFDFLICQLCKEAIPAPTTRSHIVNKHPELLSMFSVERFQMVITKLQLTDYLPTGITGPRPIAHGLAVCDALASTHGPIVSHVKTQQDTAASHSMSSRSASSQVQWAPTGKLDGGPSRSEYIGIH